MTFFEAQDIGPIESFRIEFPSSDGGGVSVIRARNQAGKSTVLEVVDAVITGDASRLRPSKDGAGIGYARGDGIEFRITDRGARRKAGEDVLPPRALASGDLATFMRPGFKSAESNDQARIRELAALTGARLKLEDFAAAVEGGVKTLREMVPPKDLETDDPLELAGRIKRRLEEAARLAVKEVEAATVDIETAERTLLDIDLTAESDPAVLDARLREAIRALSAGEEARRRRAAAAAAASEAGDRLVRFEAGATGPTQAEADREVARAEQAQQGLLTAQTAAMAKQELAQQAQREAQRALDEARHQFELAKTAREAGEQRAQSAKDAAAAAARTHHAAAEWRGLVAAQLPEAPDEEGLLVLQKAESDALDAQALGTEVARALERKATIDGLQQRRDVARARAKAWRDAAASTDDVLSEIVRRAGVPGLKVRGGRLLSQNAAGWLPIDELSDSASAELARDIWIEAAARMQKKGQGAPLVIMRQPAWEGMDPDCRLRTIEKAEARGVRLLTAEAWSGDLQVVEGRESIHGA